MIYCESLTLRNWSPSVTFYDIWDIVIIENAEDYEVKVLVYVYILPLYNH
jgi:hypothetical protein